MTDIERLEWHKLENDTMVLEGSPDWKMAEQYRKHHALYYNGVGSIKEVWRDKNGFLCVQYVSDSGELMNWFHYTIDDNEITWW